MTSDVASIWTQDTSVLFTSLWGWNPETWGTIGWTGVKGQTRRSNLLKVLTDPFIAVCYVTYNQTEYDPDLVGKIAGFFLVSHETGHRDEFTHPINHQVNPKKWQHSLRVLRAFTYLPEYRITAKAFDPLIVKRGRSVSAQGYILKDQQQIARLREMPCVEVDVYTPLKDMQAVEETFQSKGMVKAGPASAAGYVVSEGTEQLERKLYILRLNGNTEAYLGRPANGRSIYKIGLSVSPDLRRQAFQKAMPRGAFQWQVYRPGKHSEAAGSLSFHAAVAGEDAMKKHLTKCAQWLGGEFYLATDAEISEAWRLANLAAHSFDRKN